MIGALLGGLLILILAVLGTLSYAFMLADWDGKKCEPGTDCKNCPFPCEHNKHD